MTGAALGVGIAALTSFGFKTKLALCIGVMLIASVTIAIQIRTLINQKRFRRKLAEFMKEGLRLYQVCSDNTREPPQNEVSQWFRSLEAYVASMNEAYAATLTSGFGLPPHYSGSGRTQTHRQLRDLLQVSLSRLSEIIART